MFFKWLLDDTGFVIRGNCGAGWTTSFILVYRTCQLIIALSYIGISLEGAYFWKKRRDDIIKPLAWFCVLNFILFCGWIHWNDFMVFRWAGYRFFIFIIMICAAFSVSSLFVLPFAIKEMMSLPTREELFASRDDAQAQTFVAELQVKTLTDANTLLTLSAKRMEEIIRTKMWVHDASQAQDEMEAALEEVKHGIRIIESGLDSGPGSHNR